MLANYPLLFQPLRYALNNISKAIPLLISLIFAVSACRKTEPSFPYPEIQFIHNEGFTSFDTTLLLGAKIKIGISALTMSEDPLTLLHIESVGDSIRTTIDTGIYTNNLHYTLQLSKGIALNEEWSFYVRDRQGRQSETLVIRLRKDSASIFQPIRTIDHVIMGAQQNSSFGGFFSFDTQEVISVETAFFLQEKIHLLYYYDALTADANTVASPGANIDVSVYPADYHPLNWSVRNTVRFVALPHLLPEDFERCQNDSLLLANTFVFASGNRKAKNLSAGMLFSFVTDTDKKGLFLVKKVEGMTSGSIEIAIKMEEE